MTLKLILESSIQGAERVEMESGDRFREDAVRQIFEGAVRARETSGSVELSLAGKAYAGMYVGGSELRITLLRNGEDVTTEEARRVLEAG